MLVLSRKRDEDIIIGSGENAVIIRVLDIAPDRVKIGVVAPAAVDVFRRELVIPREGISDGVERQNRKKSV